MGAGGGMGRGGGRGWVEPDESSVHVLPLLPLSLPLLSCLEPSRQSS